MTNANTNIKKLPTRRKNDAVIKKLLLEQSHYLALAQLSTSSPHEILATDFAISKAVSIGVELLDMYEGSEEFVENKSEVA